MDDFRYRVGSWVLVRFLSDEAGRHRTLIVTPQHGPYRIISCNETNIYVSAVKVYFPQETRVKVHQNHVKLCPDGFLAGFYWYVRGKGPD